MPVSNPETLIDLLQSISDNSVAITQVTAELSNTNQRWFETSKQLSSFTEEIKNILKDHEVRIVDVEHNCRKEPNWSRVWNRLEVLEQAEMQRKGAKPIEDRIWNILQAVLVAAIVALVLWFMKGGAII